MSAISIDVTIDAAARGQLGKKWVSEAVLKTLRVVLGSQDMGERPLNVSVVITDDKTIQYLNRQYRGEDKVTDVLSFSPNHWGHWYGGETASPEPLEIDFVLPPEEPQPLGEVIISYQQARRQSLAKDGGAGRVKEEMALLIVHGVLHLLGYDHAQPDEETVMRKKEREVLAGLL